MIRYRPVFGLASAERPAPAARSSFGAAVFVVASADRSATPAGGSGAAAGRRLLLQTVAACAAAATLACGAGGAENERPTFSGETALQLVEKQVGFGPRVPGTPGHDAMLSFLADRLSQLADTVSVEEFTHVTAAGDTLGLANIMASFDPAARSRVLLATHWDTRPVAEKDPDPNRRKEPIPGANDGASGVAVLLGLADVLAQRGAPPGYGVDLLFLDGEDYGYDPQTLATFADDMYLGSREFARTHAEYRPLFGILLDMVGERGGVFLKEGHSLDAAPEVVRRVWQAARDLDYEDTFPDRVQGYVTDDHVFLNQAGIRTIDLIDFDYPPHHTHEDVPAKLSAETLHRVGEVLLEVLYRGL